MKKRIRKEYEKERIRLWQKRRIVKVTDLIENEVEK